MTQSQTHVYSQLVVFELVGLFLVFQHFFLVLVDLECLLFHRVHLVAVRACQLSVLLQRQRLQQREWQIAY